MEEMIRTGVPAAISLAQGIEESRAGTGWLATYAHNQFGIKCKNDWLGKTVSYDDDRRNECFRKYVNDSASWRDHSNFLKSSQRYAFLFYLDPLDYKAWAYGLQDAGYATNRKYAKKLIHLIETYHLQQYSEHALALMKNTPPDREFVAQTTPDVNDGSLSQTYPSTVFEINDRKALYLSEGTQLIAIAEKYHIRLRRLLRYNDLNSDVLNKDRIVYLEKKKGGFWNWLKRIFSGKDKNKQRSPVYEKTYLVERGDTLYGISQKYGITVRQLRKANHLNSNKIFAGQELIIPRK